MSLHFVLVTPSYNLSKFIEQTIYSVMGQVGDISIRYHIQDGGSSDGTADILAKWKRLASSPDFPKFCREILFTYSIEPDSGMYDAINRGFKRARDSEDPCIMSWINADDLLLPGALSAVSSFFEQNPAAQLVGGRTALMSNEGFLDEIGMPTGRLREDLADGLFDGRQKHFVQQEGTFWRSELWEKVGALDSTLRYAGDFDLWRRFGRHTDYHTLDSITGTHRRREGQLSSDITPYHAEVDSLVKNQQSKNSVPPGKVGFFKYNLLTKKWRFVRGRIDVSRPSAADTRQPSAADSRQPSGADSGHMWRGINGLDLLEGPFPDFAIESGRWIVNPTAEIAVRSEMSGVCRLAIDFRNPFATQKIKVAGCSLTIEQAAITRKLNINIPFNAMNGWNRFVIQTESFTREFDGDRQLGIFVEDVRIEPPHVGKLWEKLTAILVAWSLSRPG
jgi:glycosyltransferase involved in cell wall biosynthesis